MNTSVRDLLLSGVTTNQRKALCRVSFLHTSAF